MTRIRQKTFAIAQVKAVSDVGPGEFEAVLSAPTEDRDGEIIDRGAFEPLPESLPVHAFHDFTDPIGRGNPFYDGDLLKIRGTFATTPRAQEMRTLVAEEVVGSMSVGFMAAKRQKTDDVVHITEAELLEGSFVSIPSNRDANVLTAKAAAAKAVVSLIGSLEEHRSKVTRAVVEWAGLNVEDLFDVYLEATFDERVIFYVETWDEPYGGGRYFEALYTLNGDGNVELGEPVEVVIEGRVVPKTFRRVDGKEGRRNSAEDAGRIQGVHDLVCELGAECVETAAATTVTPKASQHATSSDVADPELAAAPAAASPADALLKTKLALAHARAQLATSTLRSTP